MFEIFTWGSCRYGEVKILYPEVVSEEKMHALTKRSGRVELPFAVLEVENRDSSKNLHRSVKIIPKSEVIVRYYGRSSCSKSFDEVYLIKQEGEELIKDVKQELVLAEEGKYRVEYLVRYIEYNGKKIEVSREEVRREVIPQKLEIKIKAKDGKVIVSGDTFEVRDLLKAMKFKWDGKVWYREGEGYEDLKVKLEERGVKVRIC